MMLLVCAGLVLGAQLEITGDPSSIVFNVDGTRPVEMVAQNGVLNLSGIMVANDLVTMDGISFNAMMTTIANLSAAVNALQTVVIAQAAQMDAYRNRLNRIEDVMPPVLTVSPALVGQHLVPIPKTGLAFATHGRYVVRIDRERTISFKLWGAGGGGPTTSGTRGGTEGFAAINLGGGGGFASGNFTMLANQAYTFTIGTAGALEPSHYANVYQGNGGGFSGIFHTDLETQANAIAIAGGGGGSALYDWSRAGAGGGSAGQDGYSSTAHMQGPAHGAGGSQVAGGVGGGRACTGGGAYPCIWFDAGGTGSALQGGHSACGRGALCNATFVTAVYGGPGKGQVTDNHEGGGGGGGYWGGGGGAGGISGSGGGGSGYLHPTLVSNGVSLQGVYASPANAGDAHRYQFLPNAGGGGGDGTLGSNNGAAGAGLLVIFAS